MRKPYALPPYTRICKCVYIHTVKRFLIRNKIVSCCAGSKNFNENCWCNRTLLYLSAHKHFLHRIKRFSFCVFFNVSLCAYNELAQVVHRTRLVYNGYLYLTIILQFGCNDILIINQITTNNFSIENVMPNYWQKVCRKLNTPKYRRKLATWEYVRLGFSGGLHKPYIKSVA